MLVAAAVVLAALLVSASTLDLVEVCSVCGCDKKALIQPLYSINCSRLDLHLIFPDAQQWPLYSQQPDTRMSVSFDRNPIKHLGKFPAVRGIVSLSLRYCQLVTMEGSAFVELDNLRTLDLSYNQLTGEEIQADVFRGHYSAESYEPLGISVLNLGNNDITSLSPLTFEHLPNLTELRLNNNLLNFIDLSIALKEAPATLQVLDLAYTGLSYLPWPFVEMACVKDTLQVLYLNGNNLTEVPQPLGALGNSLHKLNLNDNPIAELQEDSLRGLKNLQELNISGMSELSRIGPGAFSHLSSLEVLHCSFNHRLQDIVEDAFLFPDVANNLKQLHLRSNALHSLGQQLVPWHRIAVVDLQDNPWRCDCELKWLTSELLPLLQNYTPDLVTDLHCSEPLWLSGTNLLSLRGAESTALLCGGDPQKPSSSAQHSSALKYTLMAVAAILLLSVVAALLILCFLKRNKRNESPNIHYVRTRFDDSVS